MTLGIHLMLTTELYEEQHKARYINNDDTGTENDNYTVAMHNDRLFAIHKTVLDFEEFKDFVKSND